MPTSALGYWGQERKPSFNAVRDLVMHNGNTLEGCGRKRLWPDLKKYLGICLTV